jgi:hypothetical protein
MRKPQLLIAIGGFAIGIATCAVLGFTAGGASSGTRMLIANDGGGAYYFNGTNLYYLSGPFATMCKAKAGMSID